MLRGLGMNSHIRQGRNRVFATFSCHLDIKFGYYKKKSLDIIVKIIYNVIAQSNLFPQTLDPLKNKIATVDISIV